MQTLHLNRVLTITLALITCITVYRYTTHSLVIDDQANVINTVSQSAEYRININTATADELTLLPGVGPAIAQRIIDYREKHTRFATVEELDEVKGIGPATLNKVRDFVTIK